jgi:hypothetical protein
MPKLENKVEILMRVKLFIVSLIFALSGSLIAMEEKGACTGTVIPKSGVVGAQSFCFDKVTLQECREIWYTFYGEYILSNCEWERGKRCK